MSEQLLDLISVLTFKSPPVGGVSSLMVMRAIDKLFDCWEGAMETPDDALPASELKIRDKFRNPAFLAERARNLAVLIARGKEPDCDENADDDVTEIVLLALNIRDAIDTESERRAIVAHLRAFHDDVLAIAGLSDDDTDCSLVEAALSGAHAAVARAEGRLETAQKDLDEARGILASLEAKAVVGAAEPTEKDGSAQVTTNPRG